MPTDRYSDEFLTSELDAPTRGARVEAEILLTVPHEARMAVSQGAWYTRNMLGGRLSDCLRDEAAAFQAGLPLAGPAAQGMDPRGLCAGTVQTIREGSVQTFTYGTTPENAIREALPHKYEMSLIREDMLTVLDALNLLSTKSPVGDGVRRAASLRLGILDTIGIEEI
jgi:hypothetical protein